MLYNQLPGYLSLVPSTGREKNTNQNSVNVLQLESKGRYVSFYSLISYVGVVAFSALTLLVRHQEELPACKN